MAELAYGFVGALIVLAFCYFLAINQSKRD